MRSKQQPRPSYRWLNKTSDENDDVDEENLETPVDGDQELDDGNQKRNDDDAASLAQNSGSESPKPLHNPGSPHQQPQQQPSDLVSAMANSKSTMLRDPADSPSPPPQQQAPERRLHNDHDDDRENDDSESPSPPPTLLPRQASSIAHQSMDSSQDDVEHRIPANLIQDPNNMERELASPRCHSRDSSSGRCPSDDSMYSGRNMSIQGATSPIGMSLPPSLPPGAAAALLPSQSAAMTTFAIAAAAAAAAQQQKRLMLAGGMGGKSPDSPPSHLSLSSPMDTCSPILDFSKKRYSKSESNDENSDSEVVNLSNKSESGPLDLSVGSRKRSVPEHHSTPIHARKMSRPMDYKPQVVSPWTSPVPPYLAAAVAAAGLSPKNPASITAEWNGKHKIPAQNDATKALEKMSELSRLGGDSDMYKSSSNSVGSGGRHSAWQSHWLNKGADSTKDVLKCVWCKQSFPTLAAMSTHMKETKHCNVSVPPPNNLAPPQNTHGPSHGSSHQSNSHSHSHAQSNSRGGDRGSENSSKPSQSELNLLIKETMPLPRKLVRGQDVWLGKGAEQTRQILKCMWCGQSFRSLAEMTSHMQQTQHYTNIISQEQIISWKSADGTSGPSGSGASGATGQQGNGGSSSTVSAVFTCKVCDQSFNSLKDLSNHMVKNSHYKEHIMRSITESGGRRRQTREKRKKSLPVRKLLELERAQNEFKNGDTASIKALDVAGSRITCEKCNEKIDTLMFVEHIRQCVGGGATVHATQKNLLKSALTSSSNSILSPDSVGPLTPNSRDGRKSIGDEMSSPLSRHISPSIPTDLSSPGAKESSHGGGEKSSSPSVLNAIEQLIEKSFDTKSRHPGFAGPNQNAAPLGSSILKRLGIDESVDYTKPLIDPQTMHFLRSYHQHQSNPFGRRERSGSESSSVSERGSSRMDSLTPERKPEHNMSQSTTPRTTPDKLDMHDKSDNDHHNDDHNNSHRIKKEIKHEPNDEEAGNCDDGGSAIRAKNMSMIKEMIKKEIEDAAEEAHEGDHRRNSRASTPARSPRRTPMHSSPIPSPASERSVTPRSTPGMSDGKKHGGSGGGSLGALSSMFDSLTGSNAPVNSSESHGGGGGHQKNRSSHPLAALQKLCDKTENTQQSSRTNSVTAPTSSASTSSSTSSTSTAHQTSSGSGGTSGAIVAFSWACNDAVVTPDSIMKCAFCDTPFISKGAYRHHLSKMHFVKDDVIPDPVAIRSQKQIPPPSSSSSQSPKSQSGDRGGAHSSGSNNGITQQKSPSGSGGGGNGGGSGGTSAGAGTTPSGFDESPHSKFLKYTELAKQLSSKYV